MKVEIDTLKIKSASQQLRVVAKYLDDLIPEEWDADRPQSERLEYVTRSRSFSDAFAARDAKKKTTKKGGA